ncbi:hypothetical protein EDD15DRAFT_2386482 [Pisolithus albus]|nr:hypothetical protein EDD15DRAFT_2386482 [Pisolithus albus]
MSGRHRTSLSPSPQHIYPNETLICHGYLGCSPVFPSVAISIRTLAVFHQQHRTCPRFGIQAQAKALCHLHHVPYCPNLAMQLSNAFDAYLDILDRRLQHELGRDGPNWWLQNECPACFYKLQNEPELDFSWLVSIDGNNSLKRWNPTVYGAVPREDSRLPRSDLWLPTDKVDKFAGNVHDARVESVDEPSEEWIDEDSSVPEQRKKMFAIFDQSGIFISCCRHRFVLLGCDMVKSGELMKYPLAIVNKLLSVYGSDGAIFYDIGCTFATTLANSSIGLKASSLNTRMLVGAFHGHAHNRKCQLNWHPLYVRGTGNTEGEGCEHAIEQHFSFWNVDKYASLGNFLWNHYRAATDAICTLSVELDVLKTQLNLTDEDFQRFYEQERCYLNSLKKLPLQDRVQIQYVNRLRLQEHWLLILHISELSGIEHGLIGIEDRWEIGGAEYTHWKEEARIMKYRNAIDELERLVVMRLFELAKLGMSGTGYKLRQQIARGLQHRSEAIRNAINRYNKEAQALNPPRPQITWKEIVDYSILGEFDLLRQSRNDIRQENWAKPAHREAMIKYFRLCRAHEEVTRVEVEVCRLRTAIHNEEQEVRETIHRLMQTNPALGLELERRHRYHRNINVLLISRLNQIETSVGYSGRKGIARESPEANYTHDGGLHVLRSNTPLIIMQNPLVGILMDLCQPMMLTIWKMKTKRCLYKQWRLLA